MSTDVQGENLVFADRNVSAKRGRPRLFPDNQTRWRENKRAYRKAQQKHLKVYHRSLTMEWGTPQWFFDELHAEFGFTLDVCASPDNAKCARYFTKADDGLAQPWAGICWMNPPYGTGVDRWIRKAYESSLQGATVVCLVKSTTDTPWWHTYTPHAEVRFTRRLTFEGARHRAPFATCLVIFRPPGISALAGGSDAQAL